MAGNGKVLWHSGNCIVINMRSFNITINQLNPYDADDKFLLSLILDAMVCKDCFDERRSSKLILNAKLSSRRFIHSVDLYFLSVQVGEKHQLDQLLLN